MSSKIEGILSKSSLYIFLGLLAYMPLHILISTWIGTSLDILPFAKVAKDIVLVIGFLYAAAAAVRQPWFKDFIRHKLVLLIGAYALLTVIAALIHPTDPEAEILGVVYNTRFLLFFLYGMLLVKLYPDLDIKKKAVKIVLIIGAIVVTFGVIQYLWLPDNALGRIGYSREAGVLPAFHIDDKPDLERIMSTVRDPNSLGSYLIIIITLAAVSLLVLFKRKKYYLLPTTYYLLALAALFFTFSRSAWAGFVLAIGALVAFHGRSRANHLLAGRLKAVSLVLLLLAVISGVTLYAVRDSYFVRNVIFHADEATVLEDPNQLRLRFWQESARDIADNPLGTGPGTAGLASIRNEVQGTELNENYYLQIASEVGIIGLILFLAILAVVAQMLYRQLPSPLAAALLASFIGLAFTNLLVHIWSNEAVAYTWWGLAALALANPKSK